MTLPRSTLRDAHGKALSLNLDPSVFGTFAEIGASQEVARWFLSVGAASGTVAKTISAYDKTVSDEIYGAGTRYVSQERLKAMLDHEYVLVQERLSRLRGDTTRFFVFADTVAARNYHGTNEQHGWVGMRFQATPGAEPSQLLLHIILRDSTAQLQQEAVGILGVNLVYAVFYQSGDAETFLGGLFDGLTVERVEIDVIEFSGTAFAGKDDRVWCLELLRRQMAHAIVFDGQPDVVEPSSLLRKRPLLVMRGSFSLPEYFEPALFDAARSRLQAEAVASPRPPAAVLELTIRHATRVENPGVPEMLACVEKLAPTGTVVVTDFTETYWLSRYLRRLSVEPLRFILTVATVVKTLDESFYRDLPGTLLQGIGRLLGADVKIYVAPMSSEAFRAALEDLPGTVEQWHPGRGPVTLDTLAPPPPTSFMLDYLRGSGRLVALTPPSLTQ
jgi:hypothetical protein